MGKNKRNKKTCAFWNKAMSAEKFKKDGLWGLRLPSGDIVMEPKYDKLELCTDFIYAHYGDCHKFFYKNGFVSECADKDDDYRFYENGAVGINNSDGSVFLPADYDEIIDWGDDCDVVYVRKGNEFHYYNHRHEEILTEVEKIDEDEDPNCPYYLGEDQNRHVLMCVEPIDKKAGNKDCFAYNQWVRLSLIPCSKVREIFGGCKVVAMSDDAINHFEEKDTYIYSARVCTSDGKYPISTCIDKFKTLGCYDVSWIYLLKISVNRNTKIDPRDLYNVIKHFEDNSGCIRYEIAIDYDDDLKDGEVRVLQLHYFWDDMGAFMYDTFSQNILPSGSVEEVINELEILPPLEKRRRILKAFWWIEISETTRSWFETRKVLEYLKSIGCNDYSTLILRNLEINYYSMEEITPIHWNLIKEIVSWAISNGGQLNSIQNGKTLYEQYLEYIDDAREVTNQEPAFYESIQNGESLATWLREMGGTTVDEHRRKIESRLEGLTPKEVLDLASMKSLFIPRTYLDWSYDQDEQRNYKFMVGNAKHHFRQGDKVCLMIYGRQTYQFGNILVVGDDYMIVHTDEWLDISEEYSIRLF